MATEVAAGLDIAAQIAAAAAAFTATGMKIEEGIADYSEEIKRVQARSAETVKESLRQITAARAEGVMGLKEQGAQAAYEGRMAMTGAEMAASSEEQKLGASGVRAKGSPLLAAQQNVDIAFAAADRTIEKGNAGMKLGGLRLGNQMAGIRAQETLATAEYGRQQTELTRKRTYLQENKAMLQDLAAYGALPGLISSFYNYSQQGAWGG